MRTPFRFSTIVRYSEVNHQCLELRAKQRERSRARTVPCRVRCKRIDIESTETPVPTQLTHTPSSSPFPSGLLKMLIYLQLVFMVGKNKMASVTP